MQINDITERLRTQQTLERLNRELELSHERLRALSRRLFEVQEEERRRLARDLHDDVGQALTALKIQLESVARAGGEAAARSRVDECVDTVQHTLERVRQLSLSLRPPQLDDLGLAAAVRSHLDRQARVAGLQAHFETEDAPQELAPDTETACFRVAQEAINNVLRHARARNLWVRLFTAGGRLAISVRDDGKRLRPRLGARALGQRLEPRPDRHGGAHGARRRLVRAALGARPGHDPARHLPGGGGQQGARGGMIRVLLADDHALVRAGIHSLLQGMREVQVVGEASSGEEAVELADRERPDVVLMDIAMKGITGLEAAAQMRERYPEVRVVILSMHAGEEYVLQALRAGAVGYLLKDAATGELELALRSVMRGESWLSPSVSRQVVEGYMHRTGGETAPEVLTARQREVLKLVAGGKSTKEIAFLLNLSVKTVETHRAQIMERLGIRDVAGLVRYALRTGLVPPEG